jgi:hypothetical protein
MKLLLLSVFVLAVALRASAAEPQAANCRTWRGWPQNTKDGYTLGIYEGVLVGIAEGKTGEQISAVVATSKLVIRGAVSSSEIAQVYDALCADPINSGLWLTNLLEIVAMKFNGSPPAAVENRLAELRRLALPR